VVVRVPNQLIVQPRWDSFPTAPQPAVLEPAAVGASLDAGTYSAPNSTAPAATAVVETERAVLPKRPRGQTLRAVTRPVETAEAVDEAPQRPRPDFGSQFSAFHGAGRADQPEAGDSPDDSSADGPSTMEDESR
jgi:hypothetical protein